MQGELTATSDGLGKGSTFALELPVAREVARG
jgi:signal transduction histidine kinase